MLCSKNNNSGFTMIEILVTLAVAGTILAIATFSILSWLPEMRLKSASTNLYSNIVNTRMNAVKESKTWAIIFEPAANRYFICDDWGADGNWLGSNDNTGTGDNNIVQTFCMDGTPFASGSTPCASRKSGIVLGHGDATKGINGTSINPPSSTVSYPNNLLTINFQGLSTAGYVYLQNKHATTSYAVGTQTTGVVRSWISRRGEQNYVQ